MLFVNNRSTPLTFSFCSKFFENSLEINGRKTFFYILICSNNFLHPIISIVFLTQQDDLVLLIFYLVFANAKLT